MMNQTPNFGFGENLPDPDQEKQRFPLTDDADSLEPFDDEEEHRVIDADNPEDLAYWATQFQISIADLQAAIVLNGNKIRAIKKYLSI